MQKVMIVAALLFLGITGSPDDYGLKSAQAQSAGTDNLLFGLETGICEVDSTFAIVVHGGSVFWRGAYHSLKLPVTEQILADARVQLLAGLNWMPRSWTGDSCRQAPWLQSATCVIRSLRPGW